MTNDDHAGVIARPPFIYLAGLLAGCALEAAMPLGNGLFRPDFGLAIIGLVIFLDAVAVVVIAGLAFRRAGTTVPTETPTHALVTTGIYRFSRNPIYLALTAAYVGIALMCGAWWPLLFLPAVLWVMVWGVIEREEAYLLRKFGTDYQDYTDRVRRWL